ncbi:MAG: AtpZ/AtpI family protein [Paracoccus sp. (in: a-proteobacteria)]|nr:AtpZ/AtpI family protein [Paracoccus sp. (in: a-proteobacteria)]
MTKPDQDPDADAAERLRRLERRLGELSAGKDAPSAMAGLSNAHVAWRMVTELVAGLGIGFGIGYGLDTLFGTRPVLLVIFLLLGFAAGVNVMMRTAREMNAPKPGQETTKAGEPAARKRD